MGYYWFTRLEVDLSWTMRNNVIVLLLAVSPILVLYSMHALFVFAGLQDTATIPQGLVTVAFLIAAWGAAVLLFGN